MDELLKLAERCEKATGDDVLELINLECDICHALGIDTGNHEAPFTSSLDSAMTLVPEERVVSLDIYQDHSEALIRHPFYSADERRAATPALALCAAALRARANPSLDGR